MSEATDGGSAVALPLSGAQMQVPLVLALRSHSYAYDAFNTPAAQRIVQPLNSSCIGTGQALETRLAATAIRAPLGRALRCRHVGLWGRELQRAVRHVKVKAAVAVAVGDRSGQSCVRSERWVTDAPSASAVGVSARTGSVAWKCSRVCVLLAR